MDEIANNQWRSSNAIQEKTFGRCPRAIQADKKRTILSLFRLVTLGPLRKFAFCTPNLRVKDAKSLPGS